MGSLKDPPLNRKLSQKESGSGIQEELFNVPFGGTEELTLIRYVPFWVFLHLLIKDRLEDNLTYAMKCTK